MVVCGPCSKAPGVCWPLKCPRKTLHVEKDWKMQITSLVLWGSLGACDWMRFCNNFARVVLWPCREIYGSYPNGDQGNMAGWPGKLAEVGQRDVRHCSCQLKHFPLPKDKYIFVCGQVVETVWNRAIYLLWNPHVLQLLQKQSRCLCDYAS